MNKNKTTNLQRHLLIILLTSIFTSICTNAQNLKNAPKINFEIIKILKHDPQAFTQGLDYNNTYILESTGLYGKSSIRKYSWPKYKLEKYIKLDKKLFGEGTTNINNKIWQITWKNNTLLKYNPQTFNILEKIKYKGQGWGLTHNKKELIMSDGSCYLQFRDPKNFSIKKKLLVHYKNTPQYYLNDISYINNTIYANIFLTNIIVRINAKTGEITGIIDLSKLKSKLSKNKDKMLITNGITNVDKNHLLVTGKNWDKLFLIKIK